MGDLLQPWHLIVLSVIGLPFFAILWVLPLWFICKKAGYSPWLTLLNCIPCGTTVLLFLLAFGDWKTVEVRNQTIVGRPIA
jgi:hypothetical protein